jgi:hypothetical protein
MRTAATKQIDIRRTLTPEGARIAPIAEGFEVILGDENIALVSWKLVRAIYAYTRFISERSNLCLAFVLPDTAYGNEDQVVIHDAVLGWEGVASQLAAEFPSIDGSWRQKASYDPANHVSLGGIVPAYTMNVTQVWPPIEELRPNKSLERTREG